MDALAPADMLLFEGFCLDRRRGSLLKRDEDGVWRPVALGSRALDVLTILADRQGALLSKDEIMIAAWPGIVVADNNLAVQISALRRVLDRDRTEGSCIQTVVGRGYRFVAAVRRVGANVRAAIPIAGASSESDEPSRPRLSIVVLPFINLSNDPEQEYLADGITEDLTTDLSRIDNMIVISRNTAFTYRNKSIDTRQIGCELGVRYVLEGSVRRVGSQVRIAAQLIDAVIDAHLWAERFDHELDDLFALQNEITSRLANALGAELITIEAARPTENFGAHDFILRGRAAMLRPTSRDSYADMISLFERAMALDPESVEAQSRLASALANRALIGVTDSAATDIARAAGLAERALAAAPRSTLAHIAKANVLRSQGRCDEAIPEFETVLAIDRNAAGVLDALADCKLLTGAIEDVIPLEEQAIRLSPRDPAIGWWYIRIGQVHLLQSRPDEAIRWLEKARVVVPELPFVYGLLASAYGLKGDTERARAELAQARRFTGDDHFSSIAALKAFGAARGYYRARNIDFESTYFAGLRKAGMPEQ
ncbi:MAG: winged helix-turn-helix domain-containing protein [Alphaproteobacteria bacterium]|nr:winged helix-turn-helix domain-containing protein [Alphaproteobacteria bacterium]